MNVHKNARLTFARRLEMVHDVVNRGVTLAAAAAAHGVSVPTVRKWVARYLAEGEAGLRDRSSRPAVSPRAIEAPTRTAIVELRRRRLTQGRIARSVGVSAATVSRVLARAGLSRLADPTSGTGARGLSPTVPRAAVGCALQAVEAMRGPAQCRASRAIDRESAIAGLKAVQQSAGAATAPVTSASPPDLLAGVECTKPMSASRSIQVPLGSIPAGREYLTLAKGDGTRNCSLTAAPLTIEGAAACDVPAAMNMLRVGRLLAWLPISGCEPRASRREWPPAARTLRRRPGSAAPPSARSNRAARAALPPIFRHCAPFVPRRLDHPAAMTAARSQPIRSRAVRSQPASRL